LVSFSELHHILQLDPYYGLSSGATPSLIRTIYEGNEDKNSYHNFKTRFSFLPCKSEQQRHLLYIWCGLMGLTTYQNGRPTTWKWQDYLKHWTTDFDIDIGELRSFLRKNEYPLPIAVYPDELDNTKNKVMRSDEEFTRAFHEFAVLLPALKADLDELQKIQPESIAARQEKKKEIAAIEKQIAAIYRSKSVDDAQEPTIPGSGTTLLNAKRDARKRETQALYDSWRNQYWKLKKKHPDKSDSWYANRISRMEIAQGRSTETIRKNMKPLK